MSDTAERTIRLKDYEPYPFIIDRVDLVFRLAPRATRVQARLALRPNPAVPGAHSLRLDGEGLRLLSLRFDGQVHDIAPDPQGLTIPAGLLPRGAFTLETEVEISPETNTALEGLYMSRGMYCTQCEAEGFRHITFYPDRPDVMSRFTVRIESGLPVLLSNGDPVARGVGFAEWHDPWPKPAYLFALVAGDLVAHRNRFTTRSGRKVDLAIWVRAGDEDRCAHAMDSLKRAMRWDEEEYGREYDLDVFNIVAVDDFNMGAMENKGLNIFNSRLVLASPETATDDDFARIESVIAHEYFHNWTGDRITCRDWFQLCLKEGLTVFRDRQFSAAMHSPAVKRIEDALIIRTRQFREDQGPLAHPVRPDHYEEINNFYTATVYEKGAEVIGMLRALVGPQDYRRALDLYFQRHDGQAVTIEDWLRVFEDATGRDLSQFLRWYTQAGTPRLSVTEHWDAGSGTFTLAFRQETPPTPGQPVKAPQVLPVAVGLLNPNGDEVMPTRILEMTGAEQSFTFPGLATRPVPSILRGFSAPVLLEQEADAERLAFLLAHDTDPFNRWDAGQRLARSALLAMADGAGASAPWLAALARLVTDEATDPALRALALRLPGEEELAGATHAGGRVPDPDAIHAARRRATEAIATRLEGALPALVAGAADTQGQRALVNAALALLSRLDGGAAAKAAFARATTMTARIGALSSLLDIGRGKGELAAYEARFRDDRNVMDKWFALQVARAAPEAMAGITGALTARDDFDWRNPNRFRAVLGAVAANHAGFHHASGSGYGLLADWLIRLDPLNPQTAARMSTAFETWRRYDPARQAHARAALERIRALPGLSRDLDEMTRRILDANGEG